jgi:WD repeat-containing protein 6
MTLGKTLQIHAPITALAFTPDKTAILYGCGRHIFSYSIPHATEGPIHQVFQLNRVHGIKRMYCVVALLTVLVEQLPDEVIVLVWGSSSLCCFLLEDYFRNSSPSAIASEIIAPDWILDAQLLDPETVGLVTAHNAFHLFSLKSSSLTHRFNCEEQSLLYAAQIYLTFDKNITIASGTVFNEIQLWKPDRKLCAHNVETPLKVPIEQRLKGHEGCIFSLRFNREGTLLASCSDDRTIRVWNVREGKFLATGFAHLARVWDVRFVPFKDTEGHFLLSTSEDTSAILWQFLPGNRLLKVQERYNGHSGKHVWSQDVSSDGNTAVTGGNDGAINLWNLGGWNLRRAHVDTEVSWTEKPLTIEIDGIERVDMIRGCKCLDKDRLIVTTQSGYAWPFRGSNGSQVHVYMLSERKWKMLFEDASYKDHSVASTFAGISGWVCLGSSTGRARIFQVDNPTKV